MRTIIEILSRKREGIDCSEEESAEIKGWIKEVRVTMGDITELFPIEYGEAIDEQDADPNNRSNFGL